MKDFLKIAAGIMAFVVGTLSVLTFVRNINRQPSVILTSTECESPCWYGIQPGQTTSSQVYKFLDQFVGVNKNTILGEYNHKEELVRIFWYFQWPVEDGMGSVNIDHDRVIAINISTVNSLKLADLFKELGEPREYWTQIGYREDGEPYLDIVLLSPSQGYAAEVIIDMEAGADQVETKATTPVFRVTLFSPEMYQDLLKTKILVGTSLSRRGPSQPWSGFGTIIVKKD